MFGSKDLFSTFETNLPSVRGKIFVITGTTSGTGFIAAKAVAKHGGEIVLLNRPSPRSIASLEKLREAIPEGKFVPIDCDLQDFASVENAVEEIKTRYTSIYCLANNAGIMAVPDEVTIDGFDKQIQTNYLSHFLLTRELFPLIVAASKEYGDARIVQHSSASRHWTQHQSLEERYFLKQDSDGMLGGNNVKYFFGLHGGPWYRYYQSKLANSVFAQCLHDRLLASKNEDIRNILSLCAHPGTSDTNLFRDHRSKNYFITRFVEPFVKLFFQSAEDGSMGLLKGMMECRKNVVSGAIYGPYLHNMKGPAVDNPLMPCESDPKAKEMLWRTSEKAIGVVFGM